MSWNDRMHRGAKDEVPPLSVEFGSDTQNMNKDIDWPEGEAPQEFKFGASYVAPSGARSNARRGIELVNQGEAGDGLESATVTRAHSIADGKPLTSDHIQRMHSFFERHDKTRPDDGGKGNSPWKTAWLLWGGDAGRSWANSMYHKINGGSDEKTSSWNELMHHGRSRHCPPAEYRQWNCPLCGGDTGSHLKDEGEFNQRTFEPDEASPVEAPS